MYPSCTLPWASFCRFLPLKLLGQADGELGAFVALAGYGDLAAVGFDHGFHQAKAEAQATLGAALVAAVQAGPDLGLLFDGLIRVLERVSMPWRRHSSIR